MTGGDTSRRERERSREVWIHRRVSSTHNAKVLHDDTCRDRIGELMAGDDDQRQVERVFHAEVEMPRPGAGEEMDVGELTVVEDQQPTSPHSSSGCIIEFRNPSWIRISSNELNACEATTILNPSKFASSATRLGLREGFAADLTTARANGTLWDLSLEDDRAELRRVQNREQPEHLAESPPSDDFNSLLRTRADTREISKLKTEKIEPQIRACVQSYKLQMAMQKHFVHEHPKDSTSWEMLEVQSLINDPRVYSIDGPMCRWSLGARGSNEKVEFMRKQTRWITSSKEIAEVLRDGRWKRDRRHVQLEKRILQVECRMKVIIPQSSKANGEPTACGLTRSCCEVGCCCR